MSALESLFVVPLGCDVAANAQSDDDGTHIRATLCGDRRAFGRLYTKYYGVVHGIILCRVPERDVDDAVQEVFAAALARLDSFEVGARFGPWLSTIARNHAIDRLRVRRRSVPFQEGLRPSPPQAFEVMAARQALRQILALPATYRETMVLRFVEGMTGPEIAVHTGLTPGSVRVNLCRGMKLLRQAFQEEAS